MIPTNDTSHNVNKMIPNNTWQSNHGHGCPTVGHDGSDSKEHCFRTLWYRWTAYHWCNSRHDSWQLQGKMWDKASVAEHVHDGVIRCHTTSLGGWRRTRIPSTRLWSSCWLTPRRPWCRHCSSLLMPKVWTMHAGAWEKYRLLYNGI